MFPILARYLLFRCSLYYLEKIFTFTFTFTPYFAWKVLEVATSWRSSSTCVEKESARGGVCKYHYFITYSRHFQVILRLICFQWRENEWNSFNKLHIGITCVDNFFWYCCNVTITATGSANGSSFSAILFYRTLLLIFWKKSLRVGSVSNSLRSRSARFLEWHQGAE